MGGFGEAVVGDKELAFSLLELEGELVSLVFSLFASDPGIDIFISQSRLTNTGNYRKSILFRYKQPYTARV